MSMADIESALFEIVAPDRHVPVPTPHATESGRHCKARSKVEAMDHMVRITTDPCKTLVTPLDVDDEQRR